MSFYPDDLAKWLESRKKTGGSSRGYPGYDPELSPNEGEVTINPLGIVALMTTPSDSGEIIYCKSTSASDVGSVVVLDLLDGNGIESRGLAILNGTDLVPVSRLGDNTFTPMLVSRVNAMNNRGQAGGSTIGDVLCVNDADTVIYSGWKAEDQRSFSLLFTVPANKTAFFLPAEATLNKSGGRDASAVFRTKTRIRGGPWLNSGRWGLQKEGTSAFLFDSFDRPEIPPFTDIMISVQAINSSIDVTGRVPIWTLPVGKLNTV